MTTNIRKDAGNRRQLSLYVNSLEREELLQLVQERFADTKSLSDAMFAALQEWKDHAETGQLLRPFLEELAEALVLAKAFLREESDESDKCWRFAVYEVLLSNMRTRFQEVLVTHQKTLLRVELSDEESLAMSSNRRQADARPDTFWKSVHRLAYEDEDHQVGQEVIWILSALHDQMKRRGATSVGEAQLAEEKGGGHEET
ncbi:hypothetical protein ACFLS5_03580 [Candidatus Bipolaricaulota bacterium]